MKSPRSRTSNLDAGSSPFSRIVRVDEIKDGEERLIEIGTAERAAVAALLDLPRLDRLSFTFRFARRGQGRLALKGSLLAAVTQTCVVTLEPVDSALDIPVEIEFWPSSQIEAYAETSDEAASHGVLDWPEPIEDGKIDLGPEIYQTLATSLDPYPKREGASFSWSETGLESPSTGEEKGPFAALKQLKPRR
jgi:Large ribosomal RNA subunit accumulation protein YceD